MFALILLVALATPTPSVIRCEVGNECSGTGCSVVLPRVLRRGSAWPTCRAGDPKPWCWCTFTSTDGQCHTVYTPDCHIEK